jgi:phage baseplate assembly protein W
MATTKDRFTESSTKNQPYSDFSNDLIPHPVIKDVLRFVNENAINKSIRNLLLTNKGERLYQPDIGSDIFKMLFEPMSEGVAELISTAVQTTIADYEPRARVTDVLVIPDYDNNLYQVIVQYLIINRQSPVTLNVTLTRVR